MDKLKAGWRDEVEFEMVLLRDELELDPVYELNDGEAFRIVNLVGNVLMKTFGAFEAAGYVEDN